MGSGLNAACTSSPQLASRLIRKEPSGRPLASLDRRASIAAGATPATGRRRLQATANACCHSALLPFALMTDNALALHIRFPR